MPSQPKTQAKNSSCPCGHPENRELCDRWRCPYVVNEVLRGRIVRVFLVFDIVATVLTVLR